MDRRFHARPYRRAGAEAALAEPARRPAEPPPSAPRWSTTCRASGPASSGTCPAAGWRSPSNGASPALLRERGYGTALVLPRTWKSAIAPALAGIPERIGFVGEARFGLINQLRWGEKALPRFIDKNAALALPDKAPLPPEWPVPQLRVPADDAARWRQAQGLGAGKAVALAPGSVGASKRWTYYGEAAKLLAEQGLDVWVVGGPGEKALAQEIVATGGPRVRDLTGTDLRNGILAMAAASVAISNDSGLMHIAAALGTPTMGIFGPTSPYLWAPLNGLAATVQTKTHLACQPCQRTVCTMNDHRCMRDISASEVAEITQRVLEQAENH